MDHKPPTATIESAHRDRLTDLPFNNTADFDDADRGFIGALEPCVIKAADGRVVWNNDAYSFVSGDAPTSVHPSLWRQSKLCSKQGLYEVVNSGRGRHNFILKAHGAETYTLHALLRHAAGIDPLRLESIILGIRDENQMAKALNALAALRLGSSL